MAAYMLVQGTISDADRFDKYRQAVGPLIQRSGGKLVARGGVEVLEGGHDGRMTVLFEFPSLEAIHGFWDSPDYGPVKAIRQGAGVLDVWAIPSA